MLITYHSLITYATLCWNMKKIGGTITKMGGLLALLNIIFVKTCGINLFRNQAKLVPIFSE